MATYPSTAPSSGTAAPVPELDLRHFPAPQPMQHALAAAGALQPGQSLAVLTPLVPTPLLELLHAQGLHTAVSVLPDGGARVLIQRRDSSSPPTPDPRPNGQTAA